MFVRRACPDDLSVLIELCSEHAAYERVTFDPIGKKEALACALFSATPRLYAWVLENQGTVVGYATASREFSTWSVAEYLHLDCLYLREAHRGFGAGLGLMREIVAATIGMNLTEVQWQTPDWNEPAIRFYRRLGAVQKTKQRFTLSGTQLQELRGQTINNKPGDCAPDEKH